MVGRANRFHGRGSLKRLYANSNTVRGAMLSVRYAPNNRRKTYRLAVVVSRKVSKSAVVRNRIRRRLYENVRILSGSFTQPYDMVLLVYDERLADMAADKLADEVSRLYRKAGLIPTDGARRAIVEPKT